MAKVTIILEDTKSSEGYPAVKATCESDNKDYSDVTTAEMIASDIMSSLTAVAARAEEHYRQLEENEAIPLPKKSDPDPTLN